MDVNVSIGDSQKMALTGAALVYRGGTDAIAPQMPRALLPPQQSIHRTGGNPLQLTGHYIATMQFTQLPQTVQFAAQHRHQALAARLLENVPYFYQRCHHCRSVFRSPFSPLPQSWLKRVVQNPDQILPVQASTLLSLIQQPAPALVGPVYSLPTSSKYCLRAFMSTFHGCHVSRPAGLHFHLTQPSRSW